MFEMDSMCYWHVGLPMGWLLSPMIFTKFMRPVISFLNCPTLLHPAWQQLPAFLILQVIRPCLISTYLEDLLMLLASMADATALATDLFDLFLWLGPGCYLAGRNSLPKISGQ